MCARGRDGKSMVAKAAFGDAATVIKTPDKSETPFVESKGGTQVNNMSPSGLGNTCLLYTSPSPRDRG